MSTEKTSPPEWSEEKKKQVLRITKSVKDLEKEHDKAAYRHSEAIEEYEKANHELDSAQRYLFDVSSRRSLEENLYKTLIEPYDQWELPDELNPDT